MNLKWHNLNIGFRLSINTGVALVVWALGFFLLTHMAAHHDKVLQLYPVALTGWTGGFISFGFKRNANNKLRVATSKDDLKGEAGAEVTK